MKRPNILIIYTDQQRWDALGANGNPEIHTPHLDRLAAESVSFDHCFVQNPVCMPSRISFLTGQYPSRLGITHMGVPVPEETPTLPRLLGPAGYFCANIGKLHFLPHANRDHRTPHPDYGFDYLAISDEPGCYPDAYRAWVARKAPEELAHISPGLPPARETWNQTMKIADDIAHPDRHRMRAIPSPCREDVTHSAFVGETTRDFLAAAPRQPFLCIAGFYSPHAPWIAPERYLNLYDPATLTARATDPSAPGIDHRSIKHGYYALVSEVDEKVGEILAELERTGLDENTIVVFTSDHGEWLGRRGLYGKSYPGDDAVSRVPLLLRFPKSVGISPQKISTIVEAVDVLPTLLEAAAQQVPPDVQGVSLFPLIEKGIHAKDSALMEGTGWKSLRTERFRYLVHADGTEKLYDLPADPEEETEMHSSAVGASVLPELRRQMLQRLLAHERPRPRIWPY
jgi:arylsulfatase A-like enzyme